MAYKRQIDRLPIIPADAKKHNVVCHYCIVGCGYHAYTWPANKQGGRPPIRTYSVLISPNSRLLRRPNGIRLRCTTSSSRTGRTFISSSSPTTTAWSIRAGFNTRLSHSGNELFGGAADTTAASDRPMVWRYGQMQPTSWDDALDLVARVTAR